MICFGNYLAEDAIFDNITESEHSIDMDGAYAIMTENEINFNNIMEAVGLSELAAYSTNGEVIYEAADIRGFLAKTKEFIKKVFDKILALIKKAIVVLDRFIISDKAFIKKYEKTILAADASKVEYEGYKFTIDKWKPEDSIKPVSADEARSKYKHQERGDNLDSLRADLIGSGRAVDASDFHNEIFKLFRNGEDTKSKLNISPRDIVTEISSGKKSLEYAKKDFKTFKSGYNKFVSEIEATGKEALKAKIETEEDAKANAETIKNIALALELSKDKLNFISAIQTGRLSALRARNRQAKAIATKLIIKHESAPVGFTHEAAGSFLGQVELI